jgi:hypothetical protein
MFNLSQLGPEGQPCYTLNGYEAEGPFPRTAGFSQRSGKCPEFSAEREFGGPRGKIFTGRMLVRPERG